jgi:hypothetical protein
MREYEPPQHRLHSRHLVHSWFGTSVRKIPNKNVQNFRHKSRWANRFDTILIFWLNN